MIQDPTPKRTRFSSHFRRRRRSLFHFRKASKLKHFMMLATVLLPVVVAVAQPPDTLWTRIYPGGSNPYGFEPTPDGGYIIAGITGWPYDGYLLKIDSVGEVEWERSYGTVEDVFEEFWDVKPVPEGGYIAVGYRYGWPAHFDPATYIVRTNEFGDTLWTREHNVDEHFDILRAVVVTDNGEFICVGAAGYIGPNSDSGDVLIMRLDTNGDIIWQRRYGSDLPDEANCIIAFGGERYYIGGWNGKSDEDPYSRAYVLAITGGGDTLWARSYWNDQYAVALDIKMDNQYDLILSGSVRSERYGEADIFLLKLDTLGNELWQRRYGGEYTQNGWKVGVSPNGGYVVFADQGPTETEVAHMFILRTNEDGDSLWTASYGDENSIWVFDGIIHEDGSYAICGYHFSDLPVSSGIFVVNTGPEPQAIGEHIPPLPMGIGLLSAYPNPFNPMTTISFNLPVTSEVSLVVYNLTGQVVQTLVNDRVSAGSHNVTFDGARLSSGMYFYTLNAGAFSESRKMMLLK
jgi:hypothetical protein